MPDSVEVLELAVEAPEVEFGVDDLLARACRTDHPVAIGAEAGFAEPECFWREAAAAVFGAMKQD